MTEEQIKHGYERLDGALSPPLDALDRIERRVATRRRRRRTALAGGGALSLVVAGGAVALALGGGGGGGAPTVAVEPPPEPAFVLTRPDGSTHEFHDVTVTCGPSKSTDGTPLFPGGRLRAHSPIEFTEGGPGEEVGIAEPFFLIELPKRGMRAGQTYTFPDEELSVATEEAPILLFAADTVGANEVSSQEEETTGTVRILEASCDPTPVLRLEVDLTLGSEKEDGTTLDLRGALG